MPFDSSIKEEVRSRTDIAAVIGRYVTLKPSGQILKGLCPFHKEKTPSFHVNPAQGFFYCFGCGKGGDVFTFIEEIEGVGFSEALSMLAEECGVSVSSPQPSSRPSEPGSSSAPSVSAATPGLSKVELFEIHDIAAQYYYSNIRSSQEAVSYLKSRDLTPETVREFRLGFIPDGWTNLIDFCSTKNIPVSSLATCGLAIRNDSGRYYDRFRNRIIFSLCDLSGRVIGFAGRGMEADATPKYLNSPETILYKKKLFLYGLHQARTAIKEHNSVIIVEGYMDYLTLYQAGIRNVAATSGTALTIEQGYQLSRFTPKVILTFDGDTAGQTAAERAVFTLASLNLDLMILILPAGEDPDSLVKKAGKDHFESLLANAVHWVDFIIDRMMIKHDASTPRGKSAVVAALNPIIESIRDIITSRLIRQKLAEKLGLSEQLLYTELPQNSFHTVQSTSVPYSRNHHFGTTLEGSFLRLLLQKPEMIEEARNYVTPETLTDDVSGDIYSLLLKIYDREHHFKNMTSYTEDAETKRILSLLQVNMDITEHIHEELVQKIIHLRKKYLRHRLRECSLQIKNNPSKRQELLHLHHDFSIQLHELDGGE